jgi:hypothetical protein
MRDKPIKSGYKIWMLCDESCYNLKFQVYMGKIGNKTETGLGQRVVLDLMSGMEGKITLFLWTITFLLMNCSKN